MSGKAETGVLRMREALDVLGESPGPVVARLHCEPASALFFTGREDEVPDELEHALALAEAWDMPDVLGPALMLRSMRLADLGRRIEAQAIMALAIEVLHEHELRADEAVALANLGGLRTPDYLLGAIEANERTLALVRRLGMRRQEVFIMVGIADDQARRRCVG